MPSNPILRFFPAVVILAGISCGGPSEEAGEGKAVNASATGDRAALEKTLRGNPGSLGTRLTLSDLMAGEGDVAGAIRLIQEGISLDSSNAILWNRLASLRLSAADTAAALSAIDGSLRAAPMQPDMLLEAGFIHAARNDSLALAMADRVLSLPEKTGMHTMARYLKGVYYGNTGQSVRAMNQYDECIRSDYNFVDAYLEKGILQLEGGLSEQALKTFDMALLIANTDADAYYWRGRCLESMGRLEEASDHYAKALGLDDGLKAAREGIERVRVALKK
jgi:tetratricopeptide (TPR) repeat protein